MDFDTLQVPYLVNDNLTCRLQEDEETSAVGSDLEEEEEEGVTADPWNRWQKEALEGYVEITW